MDISCFTPLWGSWEVDTLIGQGSYGKVYRVKRTEYGKTYYSAVKHISIPSSESEVQSLMAEGVVSDACSISDYYENLLRRLMREIDINVSLKGHTNIVSYEDHMVIPRKDSPGFDVFIRMELLTPLPQLLQQRAITEGEVRKIGIDICSALEVMGRQNILHRDIKPSNIFVSASGDYKIGDFGVSRSLDTAANGVTMAGTLNYMAPELNLGQSVSLRSDLYSLGLVLYRLCNANRAPFVPLPPAVVTADAMEASNAARFSGRPLPAPAYSSPAMSAVILRACEFDPQRRFQNAGEMKSALMGNYVPAPSPSPQPATAPSPAGKTVNKTGLGKNKILILVIASICIVAALCAAIVAIYNDRAGRNADTAQSQPTSTDSGNLSIFGENDEQEAVQTPAPSYPLAVTDDYTLEMGIGEQLTSDDYYFDVHIPRVVGTSDGIRVINSLLENEYGSLKNQLQTDYTHAEYPIICIGYDLYRHDDVCALVVETVFSPYASEPSHVGRVYHYDESTGKYLTSSEYCELFGYSENDIYNEFVDQTDDYNLSHMDQINASQYTFDDLEFYFNDNGSVSFCLLSSFLTIDAQFIYTSNDPEVIPQSGHRYEVYVANLTWDEARQRCEELGGHLATFTTREEFEYLIDLIEPLGVKYCWLGGYTVTESDGDVAAYWITGEEFSYAPWCVGEPSGMDENGDVEDRILMWDLPQYGGWSLNDVANDPFYVSSYSGNTAYIVEFGDGYEP